jgi:hypothetical protein
LFWTVTTLLGYSGARALASSNAVVCSADMAERRGREVVRELVA